MMRFLKYYILKKDWKYIDTLLVGSCNAAGCYCSAAAAAAAAAAAIYIYIYS